VRLASATVATGSFVIALSALYACGSDDGIPLSTLPVDASADGANANTTDAAVAADDAADVSTAAPMPIREASGTRIVPRAALLEGLTSDGWVVFSESAIVDGGPFATAKVIALDGSGETTIASGANVRIDVEGTIVFVWTNRSAGNATLTVWSHATGAIAKGPNIRPGRAAASSDGSFIGYVRDSDGTRANIVVEATTSTSTAPVVGTLNAADNTCWQNVELAFSGTPSRYVFYACPAGVTSSTLRSVDTNGASPVDLSTKASAPTFGSSTLAFLDGDALTVAAADGTGAKVLATGVAEYRLSHDALSATVRTTTGALLLADVASATTRTLVNAPGAALLGALSPDATMTLFARATQDRGAGQSALYSDVALAFTGAEAGAPITLVPGTTSCAGCLLDNFSADDAFALAIDPIDNGVDGGGSGVMRVFAIDGGGAGVASFGTHAWDAVSLSPSRFLFVDIAREAALATGYSYDFYTRSLAASETPVSIAKGTENAAIDTTRAHLVYSIPSPSAVEGVWVATP
jgi:hypothetical protein